MLGDVSEVARQAETFGQFVGGRRAQGVVEPVVFDGGGGNLHAVRAGRAQMIVGETSHEIAVGILHRQVFAAQGLPFQSCAVVEVELVSRIPVVGEVGRELVLVPFVVFGGVLVEIVIIAALGIRAVGVCGIIGIGKAHGIAPVHRHRLVIHRGVRRVIHIVVPLVHAQAPCAAVRLARKFGGEHEFVYEPAVQARHAALHVFSLVGFHASVFGFVQVVDAGLVPVERHRGLVNQRTHGVVVFHDGLPLQAVVPLVIVHHGDLASLVEGGVVEVGLVYLAGAHVAVHHLVVHGQVRRGAQRELPQLLHAPVAHVDERGRLRGIVIHRMAVAVMIHGGQLAPAFGIAFRQGELVNLCAVLERGRFDFERSRVEILVDAAAVEPVFGNFPVQVHREFLHAEMVCLVVQRAVETFLPQLGERVDRIADVSSGDGRF